MRKNFLVFLLLITSLGCTKRQDKLIMVTEAGFAPYEYYADGTIVGVDIELAKEIALELGKDLVVKDVSFDSIIHEVKSGRADMAIAGISYSEERAKQVSFSVPYTTSRQVVVVRKKDNINSLDDVDGKKISVQLGSVADIYVSDNYDEKNIIRQKKYLASIQDLKDNKVDCVVMDELPALEMIKNHSDIRILDNYLAEDSYGVVVDLDNLELLNVINKVIERLNNEGKIDKYILEYSSR